MDNDLEDCRFIGGKIVKFRLATKLINENPRISYDEMREEFKKLNMDLTNPTFLKAQKNAYLERNGSAKKTEPKVNFTAPTQDSYKIPFSREEALGENILRNAIKYARTLRMSDDSIVNVMLKELA